MSPRKLRVSDDTHLTTEEVIKGVLARLLRDSPDNTRWRPTIPPPTFSGGDDECPEAFIRKLEERLPIAVYAQEDRAAIAIAQLRGPAAEWYQAFYASRTTTLSQLQARLVDRYSSSAVLIRIHGRLLTETPMAKQSDAEFAAVKYRLWLRVVQKDEPYWVRATIELCRPQMRSALRYQVIDTFETLLVRIQDLEQDGLLSAEAEEGYRKPRRREVEHTPFQGSSIASRGLPTIPLQLSGSRIRTHLDYRSDQNTNHRRVLKQRPPQKKAQSQRQPIYPATRTIVDPHAGSE